MSEGVQPRPLVDAEPAKPVGESSSVPRSERARKSGYRRRCGIVQLTTDKSRPGAAS